MNEKYSVKVRFGCAVRQRRYELGLSQEDLAGKAGLHRTYISDIERGARNPSLEVIERLAISLDLRVAELFSSYGFDT